MHVFLTYFGVPYGAVWSNLLASLICALLVWWRLRAQAVIHHAEMLAQAERHHRAMKDHITQATGVAPRSEKRLIDPQD